ncbi:leucine-rich repeat-containing protein 9-like [Augochlora pura]
MPNIRICDISFNCLQEFPNANFMKNLKILNISFNNIQSIRIKQVLHELEELNVSWNCVSQCLANIETFTIYTPNMLKLIICNNPFEDVDPELVEYVLYTYVPNLRFVNNSTRTDIHSPQNYYPCAINMCRVRQRDKLIYFEDNIKESEGSNDSLLTKKYVTSAKSIHITQNSFKVLNILEKAIKIQELCAMHCSLTMFYTKMPLKHLTKLNLGSNFISIMNEFSQENFPSLKYLDLTNNLITSLEPMGSFFTLQEFYCSNNKIRNLLQIDNVKTWHMLRVIDLSNNPIHKEALYKKFIICHLNNIKYISGECIKHSDITEARYIFESKLDNYVLHTIYKIDQLATITQLSITNCALSKVDLSADLLPQLESLDLSKNQITFFWGLHSFQYLHTLCLSYNCLETFDSNDHGKNQCIYPKLCTLLLDHNSIKSIMNISQQLPVIKHLFLNNNYLQSINDICHCSSLESLILDHNEIVTFTLEDFTENNNLKFLSFENNKIKSLKFIKRLQNLEKFYAANNSLMDGDELEHLFLLENLVELTFEGNHLLTEITNDNTIFQNFELTIPEIVGN